MNKQYTFKQIQGDVENLNKTINSSDLDYNPTQHKDNTRTHIANIFVYGYFALLSGSLVIVLIYNIVILTFLKSPEQIISPKDLLLLVATATGSPLGFIVGYYFKGREE